MDESGDYNSWHINENFVIEGVAIHEGQVGNYTERLDLIQKDFFPGTQVMIPFHASEITQGKQAFKKMSKSAREDLIHRVYDAIGESEYPHLVLFGTVLNITKASRPTEDLNQVFSDIITRFNSFLLRGNKKGVLNKGLVVIDQAHQERYREMFYGFKDQGTLYGDIRNVVDIPYFAGIRDTRMIQLADLTAYALFGYYEKDDDEYLSIIKHKFDKRSGSSRIDGLKHLTLNECHCESCVSRS